MYACITGIIDDITVKHRHMHSAQQASACATIDASNHWKNAVWLNDAACAYAHS